MYVEEKVSLRHSYDIHLSIYELFSNVLDEWYYVHLTNRLIRSFIGNISQTNLMFFQGFQGQIFQSKMHQNDFFWWFFRSSYSNKKIIIIFLSFKFIEGLMFFRKWLFSLFFKSIRFLGYALLCINRWFKLQVFFQEQVILFIN